MPALREVRCAPRFARARRSRPRRGRSSRAVGTGRSGPPDGVQRGERSGPRDRARTTIAAICASSAARWVVEHGSAPSACVGPRQVVGQAHLVELVRERRGGLDPADAQRREADLRERAEEDEVARARCEVRPQGLAVARAASAGARRGTRRRPRRSTTIVVRDTRAAIASSAVVGVGDAGGVVGAREEDERGLVRAGSKSMVRGHVEREVGARERHGHGLEAEHARGLRVHHEGRLGHDDHGRLRRARPRERGEQHADGLVGADADRRAATGLGAEPAPASACLSARTSRSG
jgi:hypothetical protein